MFASSIANSPSTSDSPSTSQESEAVIVTPKSVTRKTSYNVRIS